jgi:hypothetical protein
VRAGHNCPLTHINAFPYFSDVQTFEKASTTPAGRDRLRHEAAMLARARHPGVVGVVRVDEQPERTTLVLARPTDRTLAAAPPTDPAIAIRFLAALATTVADLHRLGIAHRRLQPDHVLVADDRPLLCGFAEATGEAGDADRATDDAALRDLVGLLLAHTGGTGRAGRMLRSLTVTGDARPALPAHELAHRAEKLAARTGRPGTARPVGPHPAHAPAARPVRRRVAAVLVGPVVVLAAIGWNARPAGTGLGVAPPGTGSSPGPDVAAADATTGSTDPATGARRTDTASTDPASTDPASTSAAATDSATAAAATGRVTVAGPVQIRAGGAIYEVGREGDQVVIADWRCTGEPAAVLLRPSTGELFAFDALPDADGPVTGRHLATVTGAREIVTEQVTQACPPLAVRDAAGTTRLVGAP